MDAFRVRLRNKVTGAYVTAETTSYEAAGQALRNRAWRWNSSGPNASVAGSLVTLRGKSRDIVRNNGHADNAIDSFVTAAIGTGIKPKFNTSDSAFNRRLAELWSDWTDEADADGVCDFYGQQALAVRSMAEGGDVFARLRTRLPGDMETVPFQVQLLEAEFCPVEKNEARAYGGFIQSGVEFDSIGRRVAYWLYRNHPSDAVGIAIAGLGMPAPVRATDIAHMSLIRRPGMIRGEPMLTRALVRLFDIDKYDDAQLIRQQIANYFAGFITSPAEGMMPANMTVDDEGVGEVQLAPGLMQPLGAGESVTFNNPPGPGTEYAAYMREQKRGIAVSVGILYEMFSGDFSQVNDRTWRASINEFRRRIGRLQHQVFVFQYCRPILNRWASLALLSGALRPPAGIGLRDIVRVEWIPQAFDYINPVQDVEAKKSEVRAGFKTRKMIVAEDGLDIEQLDSEFAADRAREDALGLVFDTNPNEVTDRGLVQPSQESPSPVINVGGPSIAAATIEVDTAKVLMPEQPPPSVTVNVPKAEAPVVHVHVPETRKAKGRTKTTVTAHDAQGRIKEFVQEQE